MKNPYETERLLHEYLLFHYGENEDLMPWAFGPQAALGFPVRTVQHFTAAPAARALDLGCSVGRSSFELSKQHQEVVGLDYSESFIHAAQLMQRAGEMPFTLAEEAAQRRTAVARRPYGSHPERIRFQQGDAMELPDELGVFDRVHAANLLCRLPQPRRLLDRLPSLVKVGGELVLATPCSWLEEYTPVEHWPQGGTLAWLRQCLGVDFELETEADEAFVIREHARKYQWGVSHVTRWRRK